ELADLVVDLQVRGRIRAHRTRRQLLSHVNHFADQLKAFDPITLAGLRALSLPAKPVVVQHVLDERRFARARDSGDAGHAAEGDGDVEVAQIVFARAVDPNRGGAFG